VRTIPSATSEVVSVVAVRSDVAPKLIGALRQQQSLVDTPQRLEIGRPRAAQFVTHAV
jgi:hypothetical protein